MQYNCPYGCEDGACTNATANIACTDSDNGNDILAAGTCTSSQGSFTDQCKSENRVDEYQCQNNECAKYETDCSYGYTCSNGACILPPENCYLERKLFMGNAKDVNGKLVVEYTSSNTANIEIKLQTVYSAYGVVEENEKECQIVSKQCRNESGVVKSPVSGLEHFQCTAVTDCSYPTLEGYSSEYQYYATMTDRGCPKLTDKKYLTPTYNYCEDYDKGLNYYVRSQVYTYEPGPTLYDCCVDAEGGVCKKEGALLTERYCDDKKAINATYTCPHGCKDGACIVLENEKPDLIIENISLEYSSNKSEFPAYVYTVYVKNIGKAPASWSYVKTTVSPAQPRRIEEYIYKKKMEGGQNYYMHSDSGSNIPNYDLVSGELLPPGWSERYISYFNPSGDGEVIISAQADAEEQVDESDESNNNMEKTFAVTKVFDAPEPTPVPEPCPMGGECIKCPVSGCRPPSFILDLSPLFYQTSTGKPETFSLKIKDNHQSGSFIYKISPESSSGYSTYDMPLALLPFFMSSFTTISSSPVTGRLISSVVSSSRASEQSIESPYTTATPKIAAPPAASTPMPITMPTSFNFTSALKFEYNNETEIEAGGEKTVEIKVTADREGIHSFIVRVSTANSSEIRTINAGLIVKKQVGYCGTGCLYNFQCIPFGSRMIVEGTNTYCSILTWQMEMQKETDMECQNDYECLSNSCIEGKCRKIYSLLERLWGWLSSMFGYM